MLIEQTLEDLEDEGGVLNFLFGLTMVNRHFEMIPGRRTQTLFFWM
jgi:hypothetical protein